MIEKPAKKTTAKKTTAKKTAATRTDDDAMRLGMRQRYAAALVERWQKQVTLAPDPATRRRYLMALGGAKMLAFLAENPDVQAAADELEKWGEPAPKD